MYLSILTCSGHNYFVDDTYRHPCTHQAPAPAAGATRYKINHWKKLTIVTTAWPANQRDYIVVCTKFSLEPHCVKHESNFCNYIERDNQAHGQTSIIKNCCFRKVNSIKRLVPKAKSN